MNETMFVIVSASAIVCAACAVVATRQRAEPAKVIEPSQPEPVLDIDEQIAKAGYLAEHPEYMEPWELYRLRYPHLYQSHLAHAKAARVFLAKYIAKEQQ